MHQHATVGREIPMTQVRGALRRLLLVAMIATGGCATIHRNEAQFERELLLPAGFDVLPADSPERAQELRALPPLKMVTQVSNGRLVYRLADPYLCDCVYVG